MESSARAIWRLSLQPRIDPALAVAFAVVAATGVTAAIALERSPAVAVVRATIFGATAGVGLYVWGRRPERRFGLVLLATGGIWFLTTFAESTDPALYTVGRATGWIAELALVYAFLSFPSGTLRGRADRHLVGAAALVGAVLFLPRLLLVRSFEVPSPVTSCVRDCPPNALFAFGRQPGIVDAVLRPLGTVLVIAFMTAIAVRLWRRAAAAPPIGRRLYVPVLIVAAARAGLLAAGFIARTVDAQAWPTRAAAWLLAAAVPLVALAFLAGVVRWRLFAGRALGRLAVRLPWLPDAAALRRALAEAFEDPSVEIVFPRGRDGRWTDAAGRPVPLPEHGRSVSAVYDGDTLVAAIVHDPSLRAEHGLLDAGVAMAGVVLEKQRLADDTSSAIGQARAARARIAASAERERRRIARDIHDGAQQRLVALRVKLALAADLVRGDPERGAVRLRELEQEVEAVLVELRSLAHGIDPPLLRDRGLAEALRAETERLPLPAKLVARDVGRYAPEIESAVYFCVLEALQNVVKHAVGTRRVVVTLAGGQELGVTVRDDGCGARGRVMGAGITNMRERLTAIGGGLAVVSVPGVGTEVRGSVPLAPRPVTPPPGALRDT